MAFYIAVIVLLNIPFVQRHAGRVVSSELSSLLGTEVKVGRVEFGLPNRLIVEDIALADQTGAPLAGVSRASAKISLLSLLSGKVSIGTAQLFGLQMHLQKDHPEAIPNYQFVLDALASKDSTQQQTDLHVRINSLLVRKGTVTYDVLSEPLTPDTFNVNHLDFNNIVANISLKALTKDSLNAAIRRMSFEERQSGFKLDNLNFHMVGNKQQTLVKTFNIELPDTRISMDSIHLSYDLPNVKNVADDVQFDFQLGSPKVTLRDFSAFLPLFRSFTEPLSMQLNANGTLNNLHCPVLAVNAGNHIVAQGNALFSSLSVPDSAYVRGRLERLRIDEQGIPMMLRNLNAGSDNGSEFFQRLGTTNFSGDIDGYFNSFNANGLIETALGNLRGNVKLSAAKQTNPLNYAGNLEAVDFQLGKLLAQDDLGNVSLAMDFNGHVAEKGYPDMKVKGLISALEYKDYTYEHIDLDGEYRQGGFNGAVLVDDENLQLSMVGNFNTQSSVPVYDFTARLNNLRPAMIHLTDTLRHTEASGVLRANLRGHNIDDMIGSIDLDSMAFSTEDESYFLRNFHVAANKEADGSKLIDVDSEVLKGQIKGAFSYQTLPASIMKILERYIPSLVSSGSQKKQSSNVFEFSFRVANTDMLAAISEIPIKIYSQSMLSGYVNERLQQIRVEGFFPRLRYDDRFIESGRLLCDNQDDRLNLDVRFNNVSASNSMNVSAQAYVQNDSLSASINWGNNGARTYSGRLAALTHFERVEKEHKSALKTTVQVQPSDIIISDTLWNIQPSTITLEGGKVAIDDFLIHHEDRHLSVNGLLSDSEADSVYLDLKGIDLKYVFDVADLGVNISGFATGPAVASCVMKEPKLNADLFIESIGFEDGYLGDAQAHLEWHHPVEGLYIDVDITEQELAKTHVEGYIYPIKPTSSLDLQINAGGTNLKFLQSILSDLTPELYGRAFGDVRVYGKFKALTLDGVAAVDAAMKIDFLNIYINLTDTIQVHPGGLRFVNNRVFDNEGHMGHANGEVNYEHFKNIRYNFDIDIDNMQLLNTKSVVDFPFYGTVYGTGNVNISGNPQTGMNIDVAVTTNKNSVFTYIKDYVSTATEDGFIKFVDKTPRRTLQDPMPLSEFDLAQLSEEEEEEDDSFGDIRLNLVADVTRDMNLRIVMDPFSGDNISCYGSGNLSAEFFNKGDFKLFGAYNINQGVYKMSIQQIMKKDFTILDGSSITFDGEPLDGVLDLQTRYQVNSASLNDLIPNARTYVDQTLVRVNCLLNMTGRLTSPSVSMGLELPLERDEVQALVQNYIATDEQMNTQILYLLTIGKFYMPENNGSQSNIASSVVSSTLSGQLNSMLSNVINNNNWNFGTNFSTGEEGWNDMEVEGILSGQLLNNRLLINGNFGYRENQMMTTNTNFVGDFEAEWLVNSSGNIRLKAYNETNDRSYIRTNLTTQGIGIIFKKDFDRLEELLPWYRWKRRQLLEDTNTNK